MAQRPSELLHDVPMHDTPLLSLRPPGRRTGAVPIFVDLVDEKLEVKTPSGTYRNAKNPAAKTLGLLGSAVANIQCSVTVIDPRHHLILVSSLNAIKSLACIHELGRVSLDSAVCTVAVECHGNEHLLPAFTPDCSDAGRMDTPNVTVWIPQKHQI